MLSSALSSAVESTIKTFKTHFGVVYAGVVCATAHSNASTPERGHTLRTPSPTLICVVQCPSISPYTVVNQIVTRMKNGFISMTCSFIVYPCNCHFTWDTIIEHLFNFLANEKKKDSDAALKECIQVFVAALMDYAHTSTTSALKKLALRLEVLDMICILSQHNGDDYHSIEVVKDVVQITYKQVKTQLETHNTLKNVLGIECSLVCINIIHD